MNFDDAIRLTEILLALSFIQQSVEHLRGLNNERWLFAARLVLSLILLAGFEAPFVCLGLVGLGLCILQRFQGPYNGGSDRMSLLILCCLCLVHFVPPGRWQEYVFGYLAVQLVLSYFIAGTVKIVNPEWRMGRALQDVFLFSAYPVAENLRVLADYPRLLFLASWSVMLFELAFPFMMLSHITLVIALVMAAAFHFANAMLFGLNRFFWIWIAAYPSLIWLQNRIIP